MNSLQDGKWMIEYLHIGQLLFPGKGTEETLLLPYQKTIILNGDAGEGKSKLAQSMGIEFCQRLEKQFGTYGSVCSHGALTKAGKMHMIGTFVFSDFDLVSRGTMIRNQTTNPPTL